MDSVREWWGIGIASVGAAVGAIFWLARLEGGVRRNNENITRQENRLSSLEKDHKDLAIEMAGMSQTLKGIKDAIDRIYYEMPTRRVIHHTDKTDGFWRKD